MDVANLGSGNMLHISLLILLLTVVLSSALTTSRAKVGHLVRDLKANYSKSVRPVKNSSTVVVKHRMTPIQIMDVDERNQVIILKSWCEQAWRDDYLTWNEMEYDGAQEIQLPVSEIWQPDIVLYSSVDEEFIRHYDTDARVTSSGQVIALQPFMFRSSCYIDSTFFPFDKQNCLFTFGSWSYPLDLIDIVPSAGSNIDNFIDNGEWDVLAMPINRSFYAFPCCPDEPFSMITYTIRMKRRSIFYVLNIILPAFLVSTLVVIGSFLPSDSGERMTLSVSSMLSLMVLLSTSTSYMPTNSETVPYLERYLFVTIALVTVSCGTTAMTLNMHFRGSNCRRPPLWLRRLVLRYMAWLLCADVAVRKDSRRRPKNCCWSFRAKHAFDRDSKDGESSHGSVMESGEGVPLAYLNSSTSVLEDFPGNSVGHEKKQSPGGGREGREDSDIYQEEWKEIARMIDRLFLFIYGTVVITLTSGILIYMTTNTQETEPENIHGF
ncbi:neuronal acetylcholine receptor subunit alpha-10-like [Ptychodera flava]|uniref:neuronal acetylcholine receptor subunit alpha-10-like n=1 Tax=Ptychodera flava TaxID=63121 RepID=UPI00396AA290